MIKSFLRLNYADYAQGKNHLHRKAKMVYTPHQWTHFGKYIIYITTKLQTKAKVDFETKKAKQLKDPQNISPKNGSN